MRDVLVVSLSPAIDRNYRVSELKPGQVHRCHNPLITPGGKGVNVARVLALLGAKVCLIGLFAGEGGRFIVDDLERHGVETKAIWTAGETRISVNILDSSAGRETEILEEGPLIAPEHRQAFASCFEELLTGAATPPVVVFSGGIPRGLPTDAYRDLIHAAKGNDARTFLDTSSDALKNALAAGPYFIKPNPRELSQILGEEEAFLSGTGMNEWTPEKAQVTALHKRVARLGIDCVALTLAHRGALLCLKDKALYANPLPVTCVNAIGCGDSFTAGFAFASAKGFADENCLRYAVACASSNTQFEEVGMISAEQVERFVGLVKIDEYTIINGSYVKTDK